jgi:hypothetical protein
MQKVILPLVSGFLAALFFRESTIAFLHAAGLVEPTGFSTTPFLPLGIPEFVANALWTSVFAILMAWLLRVAPDRTAPWIGALVFGGIVVTAAGAFVIDPVRGIWPTGNMMPRLFLGFVANAMWGWGTLVFMRAFSAGTEAD